MPLEAKLFAVTVWITLVLFTVLSAAEHRRLRAFQNKYALQLAVVMLIFLGAAIASGGLWAFKA